MKSIIHDLKNSAYENLVSKETSSRVPQSVLKMNDDAFRECYEYCYERKRILHQSPMCIDLRKKNNYVFKYQHLLPLEYHLSAYLTNQKLNDILSILRHRLERLYPYDDIPRDTELVFFSTRALDKNRDMRETDERIIHRANKHTSCGLLPRASYVFETWRETAWDWTMLSNLPHIATEDNVFHAHPDVPWDWNVLTMAKDTIGTAKNIFERYPGKPWDTRVVNARRDLVTRKNVFEKYPQSPLWDFATLFQQVDILFDADDEEEWNKKKATVDLIEKNWWRCLTDPKYLVCQQRLMREFGEMEKELIS